MFAHISAIPYQYIALPHDVQLMVKRLDLVHPTISGNKFFKLKYNFLEAKRLGYTQVLSFGGAYSNHILALAYAAHEYSFQSIAIIRGEELADLPLNPTLQTAQDLGMQFKFISRADYRLKHTSEFLAQFKQCYPHAYIIPEGGTNAFAIKGCEQILSAYDTQNFDVICCAVGTGGTIAGIINASLEQQQIIGFAALKADFLTNDVKQWVNKNNWSIFSDDTFGGYGKFNPQLLDFIEKIKKEYDLPLEPIYTGKAFYQLLQWIQTDYFPQPTRILFIHTGGLQTFQQNSSFILDIK
ncbi:MAG: pyridoxal-phosphate dependent enzyme [Acinetobacter sp.]|jgi:1-aminocyclopropane-1-carboxylate deaminase/D-cysteine desulfhydrase-like pyridoxal-dependent ACC family enzyme|nr:MAG: pyridoxal-phosphate dependent enzyme [Acinetobacter sp.]